MLTVYKASAGSGKTFRLVAEYLKLLLARPQNHRHILAVTFTNKATAEMKARIVEHLGLLAAEQATPYRELLQNETALPEGEIGARAARSLNDLLFDYSRFQVSTIDKFTQRVLKSFCREMGINPGYVLETDNELLIAEAADRLVAGLDANAGLRAWLESFVEDKINNSKSFDIAYDLRSLGKELFRERLQERMKILELFFEREENAREYLGMLNGIVRSFTKSLRERAAALVAAYRSRGFTAEDFSYGMNGVAGFLEKAAGGTVGWPPGARVMKAAAEPGGWVARGSRQYAGLLALATGQLQPGLAAMMQTLEPSERNYHTANTILSEWYTAAVLNDLYRELNSLGRERAVLPLAGSNLLLRGVIDGSDTPFVYEKTGDTIHHLMLDEFQDTSVLQWANFKPLMENSLASGKKNLVVGDVKQSIYRWRNSDWNLLGSQIFADFSQFPVKAVSLEGNYRSGREIVDFNNRLFSLLPSVMAAWGEEEFNGDAGFLEPLEMLYRDAEQQPAVPADFPAGFAGICHWMGDPKEFAARTLEKLLSQVRALQELGFRAQDIAILVRKKEQGAAVVRHFLAASGLPGNEGCNLRMVSGDSLLLGSSPGVSFIIHWLKYFMDPDNLLVCTVLLHLYNNCLLPPDRDNDQETPGSWSPGIDIASDFRACFGRPLDDLEPLLAVSSLDEKITRLCAAFRLFSIESELPFLQLLIDKAAEIKPQLRGDVAGFLEWWEEKGRETAVQVNEETDAIRLLTIHKAKGLQFKAVLIPFFDWRVIENKKNILWVQPAAAPFNRAPLVPVSFAKSLRLTWFEEEYRQELFNMLVDNLNLVYVAFTRAISVLWVNLPSEGAAGTMGPLLKKALAGLSPEPAEACGPGEWQEFRQGKMPHPGSPQPAVEKGGPATWHFTEYAGRLRLRSLGDDLPGESGVNRRNYGNQVHALLAMIRTEEELEPACRRALAAGMVHPGEMPEISRQIGEMFSHPVATGWFSGKYRVFTETELLTPLLTLRPDRIMIRDNHAVVVDYKTGDPGREEHLRQVRQYVAVLRQAGYSKVEGYLWYLRHNQLIGVV